MYREKFNLKYNFCYYYFSVMKDMTSESPTLLIYILKRKTSSSIYIYKMIILFKYCADVENCGSFRGFGFIYIYR